MEDFFISVIFHSFFSFLPLILTSPSHHSLFFLSFSYPFPIFLLSYIRAGEFRNRPWQQALSFMHQCFTISVLHYFFTLTLLFHSSILLFCSLIYYIHIWHWKRKYRNWQQSGICYICYIYYSCYSCYFCYSCFHYLSQRMLGSGGSRRSLFANIVLTQ